MKKIIVTLSILVMCSSTSFGQDVWVSSLNGSWDGGTRVRTGRPVTWTININTPPEGIMGSTNGFKIYIGEYSPPHYIMNPGPGFTPITYSTVADFSNYAVYAESQFGVDGYGADTIGFGGVSFNNPVYLDNQPTWSITTMVDTTAIGNYLCIDSSWFPPGGTWTWGLYGGGTVTPSWDGPHCYLIDRFDACCLSSGDVNWDDKVLVDDLIYLVNYLFKSGPPTPCPEAGDVNLDGHILVDDLTYLVNYLFKSGPPPPPCY
ncbi:MAG: dockerin type I repeat-containing protein [bacterium]